MSATLLSSFKKDWYSNPKWWFAYDPQIDEYISEKYGELLDDQPDENEYGSWEYISAWILVYDQLSRHVLRREKAKHIISFFCKKATELSLMSIENGVLDTISCSELTFLLLPLRHGGEWKYIKHVLEIVWKRMNVATFSEDKTILQRFLAATYKNINISVYQTSLIEKCQCKEFRPISPHVLDKNTTSHWNDVCQNIMRFYGDDQQIIMSLSGGVDSMVCSWWMRHLFPQKKIVALMINYNNRPSCENEVLFVKEWCEKKNIYLYIRHIDEIHRPTCMNHGLRDVYEEYTRNIRYECYKTVWNDLEKFDENSLFLPRVLLGHNKDDSFENIMTNITMRNHYNNLRGMDVESITDGICFIRPLLSMTKDDILTFAKNMNIPHLPNSTPPWSQRGKIRRDVVPVLNAWHNECISGIFAMADMMHDFDRLLCSYVETIVKNMWIRCNDDGKYVVGFVENTCKNKGICGESFLHFAKRPYLWNKVFQRLLIGTCVIISQKSILHFVQQLDVWTKGQELSTKKIVLHKKVCIHLDPNRWIL
jgi:tRNA(Ile)-lysidine synthetase-like protein